MKTRQRLICLAFLIGIFVANAQAQPNRPDLGNKSPGVEKQTATQRKGMGQSPGSKKSNSFIRTLHSNAASPKGNEGKSVYGFRVYDEVEWPYFGIVQFNTANPGRLNVKFKKDYSISAGAFAKGTYYICKLDQDEVLETLSSINLQTGAETVISDISQISKPKSMTYDYTTETMYLLQWKKLSKINLANGKIEGEIQLPADLIAIACSYDGHLYGIITETSEFVEINTSNGKLKIIGKTGKYVENLLQSMDFDHETNTLYWAGYSDETFLATIDVQTGAATTVGSIGNNSEIVGLYIPFSLCPADAPNEVTGLKTEPDKNGGLNVNLSWKNPDKTYGGAQLGTLSGIKIYRNGTLIKTLTPAQTGTSQTYADQVPASGKMQYKIVPYNTAGDGAPKYSNIYAGQDYPSEITGLGLTKSGQDAKLTWAAPAAGSNNGWLDPASVKYKITRYPDKTVLEAAYAGSSSYTDRTIKGLDVYSYTVEAFNTIGSSQPVGSNRLTLGSHIVPPYTCDFSTQDHFNLWQVIDNNNDRNSWTYNSWEGYAVYTGSEEKDADDWLVSSAVQLETGKYYKLSVDLSKAADWLNPHENFKITMGTSSAVINQTTLLGDYPDYTAGVKNISLKVDRTGEYYFGFRCYSLKGNYSCEIKNIKLTLTELIDIAAVSVASADSIAPVNSARAYTVTVENKGAGILSEYTVELTDEAGNSLCTKKIEESLAPGTTAQIQLNYTSDKEGEMKIYARATVEADADPANNTTPESLKMEFRKAYTVTGKITDADNTTISDAFVKLTGFRSFTTESGQDGTFTISDVYSADDYELLILKNGFTTEKRKVVVNNENVVVPVVKMNYCPLKPVNLKVTNSSSGNTLNWTDGVNLQKFRRDNEINGGAYGPINPGPKALVGTVYEQPTRLTQMSWVTDENSGKHATMNLFVLALDKNAKPTSEVLFSKTDVPNVDSEWGEPVHWNTFTFPTPIEAPHGFFVAVGCNQGYALFVDDLGHRVEYPFTPETQFVTGDYTSNSFSPIEETFYPINFFIRAEGTPTGTNQATKYVKGYKVWRLLSGKEGEQSAWKELTPGTQTGTTINDNTWKDAAQGVYRYAVRTEYIDGKSSDVAFSEEIQKDMLSKVSIQVKTNTTTNETEGAEIILKSRDRMKEHTYEATLDNSGKIDFTIVWKGTYDLTVRKNGFDLLEAKGLEIGSQGNTYSFGPYTLTESILKPYNLSLTGQLSDKSRTLNWNLFPSLSDDFESHENFEINSGGNAGWQYLDGDNAFTYGIGDEVTITFPNQNKKMAGIIFNPSATTPPLTGAAFEVMRPHSGDKFLAFMASSNQLLANDDYLISPELAFEDDFKFRFYARSCEIGVSPEQMKVGYSVTGTNPEDFTWFNEDEPFEVPNIWTEYKFDIPSNAKYVTINYMAYDLFMLMIDDVFIGYEGTTVRNSNPSAIKPGMRDHKCELYVDGNKVGEAKGYNYTFSNLTENNKVVGVRTIYPSGSSEMVTIKLDASSIENNKAGELDVYFDLVEKTVYLNGTYQLAELFDASGKLVLKETNTEKIDLRSLPASIYILRIYNQDNAYSHKLNISR